MKYLAYVLIGIFLFWSKILLANLTPEFVGGIQIPSFQNCSQLLANTCNSSRDKVAYQQCFNRINFPPYCNSFVAFAKKIEYSYRDQIDNIRAYGETSASGQTGTIYLIHVLRWGSYFPGDFFIIDQTGALIYVMEVQNIDIRNSPQYLQFAAQYPKVDIWPIVLRMPTWELRPDGGQRMTFRFELLNGCYNCAQVGYANVAFDFSKEGVFEGMTLLSLMKHFAGIPELSDPSQK